MIGQTAAAAEAIWYARLMPRFLAGLVARHLRGGSKEVVATLVTLSEIIDEHQIADIMAGGEARVPAGWEDVPPPAPPSDGTPTATPDVSSPASQH